MRTAEVGHRNGVGKRGAKGEANAICGEGQKAEEGSVCLGVSSQRAAATGTLKAAAAAAGLSC